MDQVLNLLRGAVEDRHDQGLCGEVTRLRRDVNSLKNIRKWAIACITAALLTIGKTVISVFSGGGSPPSHNP